MSHIYTKEKLLGMVPLYDNHDSTKLERMIGSSLSEDWINTKYCLEEFFPENIYKMGKKRFCVYEFDQAPGFLKMYCHLNGGDEDWLIIVNKDYYDSIGWEPSWLSFNNDNKDFYEIGDFWVIVVSHV